MITSTIAAGLKHGQILHHITAKQANGKEPLRVRVTGKCKLWKRDPERFQLPVKHGLYEAGYIDNANAEFWVVA